MKAVRAGADGRARSPDMTRGFGAGAPERADMIAVAPSACGL